MGETIKLSRVGWPDTVIMSETQVMHILVEQMGWTEAEALEWLANIDGEMENDRE